MITSLLLSALLCPQDPVSLGDLTEAPMTVFVHPLTASQNNMGQQSSGHYKVAGDQTAPPNVYPDLGDRPNFSGTAKWAVANVVIDAFSTNVNWIAAENGRASARTDGGTGWAGIAFVPTPHADPITGSRLFHEQNGRAGDVYQYLFSDSEGAPQSLIGETERAVDSFDVRIDKHPEQTEAEITAMDVFVPYLLFPNGTFPTLRQEFHSVVFSVSTATLDAVPEEWWTTGGSEPQQVAPSGAALFACTWQATQWSDPRVFLKPEQLGLAAEDDITAVAWDSKRNRLLFSSNKIGDDPIMFVDLAPLGSSQPLSPMPLVNHLEGPLNATISKEAGLEQDPKPSGEIRVSVLGALCGIDPRVPDFGSLIGRMGTGAEPAHISIFRTHTWIAPRDDFTCILSAPRHVFTPPAGSYAVLQLRFGTQRQTYPIATKPYGVGVSARHTWQAPSPMLGVQGYAQWLIFDSGQTQIGATPWTKIRF